jgi:hypothetical protein
VGAGAGAGTGVGTGTGVGLTTATAGVVDAPQYVQNFESSGMV